MIEQAPGRRLSRRSIFWLATLLGFAAGFAGIACL